MVLAFIGPSARKHQLTASPLAPHPVALQGFNAFERNALAAYLRVPSRRVPAYEQIDTLDGAEFIIADADHPGVMEHVLAANRVGDTVFVGAQSPEGALAWMMRPIDPVHVFHELDAVCAMRGPWRMGAVPQAAVRTPAERPPVNHSARPTVSSSNAGAEARPARRASDAEAVPVPASAPGPHQVLLVGANQIGLRQLERRFEALQLRPSVAVSNESALSLMAQRSFGIVFINMASGPDSELDALALCQLIKRHHRNPGSRAPVVVMLATHEGAVERVRATLAGCDAYLIQPFDEAELQSTLMRFGALLARPGRTQRPRTH